MRIYVRAKTNSKENKVEPPKARLWKTDGWQKEYYVVYVKEPPIQGRANRAIIKTIAEYFNISPTLVVLVSGMSSKNKVFEIPE
jgi:uncharacterized protein